jgi:radical SAM protein with 4Fe4S-binding SPASM domain
MACDEVGYQQYFTEIAAKVGTGRVPLNAIIELTERCNLRCQHCYIHDPAQDHLVRSKELTTEQWFRILDELAEAGCLWMTWTGGEILLRTDFADLYRYAKCKGFLLVLFTNGTLLTPKLVALFQEWYPHYLEITLYGMTAKTYERVTGVRGSYEMCIRGIEALSNAGIPLRLKTVGMTLNKHELPAMYDYAASLDVGFRHDSVLRPTFHGQDIRDLRLSPEEVVDLETLRPEAEDALGKTLRDALDGVEGSPMYDPERLYNCGAGFRFFHIDPYGQLTICHMVRSPGYDLTVGTFREGWEDFLGRMRSAAVSKNIPCHHCRVRALCVRCPAFANLENKDPETVVEYACEIAHLRAAQLGFSERIKV